MISIKDIPMLVGLGASVVTGSFYVHDLRRDITELSKEFQRHSVEQSIGSTSDRLFDVQERIKDRPGDERLKREEQELSERKERLQKQLDKIEGVPQ